MSCFHHFKPAVLYPGGLAPSSLQLHYVLLEMTHLSIMELTLHTSCWVSVSRGWGALGAGFS